MARNVVGSIRSVKLNSVPFRAAFDANMARTPSAYENSRIATSGESMRKMMKRILSNDGLVLICNADELLLLQSFADSLDDIQLEYTNAAGDQYQAVGSIDLSDAETEEGRVNCRLDPNGEWTAFVA